MEIMIERYANPIIVPRERQNRSVLGMIQTTLRHMDRIPASATQEPGGQRSEPLIELYP